MKEGTRHLLEKAERAIQAADVLLTTLGAEFAAGRASSLGAATDSGE